uniref:Uncharacterized protein n=1 Tax=Trichinella nativa TaxID=6335 RepID=A0A0V1KJ07_9BILA
MRQEMKLSECMKQGFNCEGMMLSDCVTQEMDPERLYEAGGWL